MTEAADQEMMAQFRRFVAEDLDLLAALHDREIDHTILPALQVVDFGDLALDLTAEDGAPLPAAQALTEMIAALPLPLDQDIADDLAASYADVYLTNGSKCPPYESPWLDKDHLMRQQPTLAMRRWYRRHGLSVPDGSSRPEDHLVHQLNFIAYLLRKEEWGDEALAEVQLFLARHPLLWLPEFAEGLKRRQAPALYGAVAALTLAYLQRLHAVLMSMDLPLVAVEGLINHMEGVVGGLCDDGKGPACCPDASEPL